MFSISHNMRCRKKKRRKSLLADFVLISLVHEIVDLGPPFEAGSGTNEINGLEENWFRSPMPPVAVRARSAMVPAWPAADRAAVERRVRRRGFVEQFSHGSPADGHKAPCGQGTRD